MVRNCRNTVRAATLSAFLLLLLPAGASAAPTGLLDGVVETTSTTAARVQQTVSTTVETTRQNLEATVDPARSAPVHEVRQQLPAAVAKPAAETVKAVEAAVPEAPATTPGAAAPRAPTHADRTASEARRQSPATRAGEPRRAAPESRPTQTLPDAQAPAAERPSTPTAPTAASTDRPAGGGSSGVLPDGPGFGAVGGGSAASAAFSAGALAVLLTSLFLAASALRARLPRIGEVGRPLPLVFALERPG